MEAIYLHSGRYLFFQFRLNCSIRRFIRSLLRASDQRARASAHSLVRTNTGDVNGAVLRGCVRRDSV